jgi:hypothetical protein
MDRGTILHCRFSEGRALPDVMVAVDDVCREAGIGCQTGSSFSRSDSDQLWVDLNVQWFPIGRAFSIEGRGLIGAVSFSEKGLVGNQVFGAWIKMYKSEFWPELMDSPLPGYSEPNLADACADYRFVKRLCCRMGVDLCVGSPMNDYVRFEDMMTDSLADRILRFTRLGPQKLVRPLEECRLPYRGYGDHPGPYDEFATDPETGLPKWAMLVDKPLSECL